jgi:hypothetical protein
MVLVVAQHSGQVRGGLYSAVDVLPYRDVTVGDLLTRLSTALPDSDALVSCPDDVRRWIAEHDAGRDAR